MQAERREEVQLVSRLTSALDGCGWSSRPTMLSWESAPVPIIQEPEWKGVGMGKPCPHHGSNPEPSSLQEVAILTTLSQPSHDSVCYNEVDCVWNVMAHAQKPDFVFGRNGRVHLDRRWESIQLTTVRRAAHISLHGLYCSCKPVFCSHVTLTGYPLNSHFPFTSPPVHHRVPSHFNWTLQQT
jgi:hypothetical protein